MPMQELPGDFYRPIDSPSNSSLSSNSSGVIMINARYVRSTISSSESSGIDEFETNVSNAEFANHNEDLEEEATYQPIKLPKEPTLEELLRQVTAGADISLIQQIKLCIISSAVSLHRLPYFMPNLRVLNLEGSMLFSLRDLGYDLSSLSYLNISRCGLKSLDGTNGLSNLTEMVVDFNLIEDAGPCSNLPRIVKISLISNKIKDFQGVMFLGLCTQLKVLDLENNTVTLKANYRETVLQNIPDLLFLDKIPLTEISEQAKMKLMKSEYLPENNGATRKNLNASVQVSSFNSGWDDGQAFKVSQLSSVVPPVMHISIARRPMTSSGAKSKYDVSVGSPISGNIINKARKPRKLKTAWGDSLSSSSFSSSDSSAVGTPINHPLKRAESCDDLLESARLWREKSKKSRDKFNI